jgi:hypothetical protein
MRKLAINNLAYILVPLKKITSLLTPSSSTLMSSNVEFSKEKGILNRDS